MELCRICGGQLLFDGWLQPCQHAFYPFNPGAGAKSVRARLNRLPYRAIPGLSGLGLRQICPTRKQVAGRIEGIAGLPYGISRLYPGFQSVGGPGRWLVHMDLGPAPIKKLRRCYPPEFLNRIVECRNRLGELDIDRIQAFFAFFCLESDDIALPDFVNQTADVNENLLAGG